MCYDLRENRASEGMLGAAFHYVPGVFLYGRDGPGLETARATSREHNLLSHQLRSSQIPPQPRNPLLTATQPAGSTHLPRPQPQEAVGMKVREKMGWTERAKSDGAGGLGWVRKFGGKRALSRVVRCHQYTEQISAMAKVPIEVEG